MQIDVKSAFLNPILDEVIDMKKPQGCKIIGGNCSRLQRSLHRYCIQILMHFYAGFRRCAYESHVYFRGGTKNTRIASINYEKDANHRIIILSVKCISKYP